MKLCPHCQGQKIIRGMGHMKVKCPECKGKGYQQVEQPLQVKTEKKLKKQKAVINE